MAYLGSETKGHPGRYVVTYTQNGQRRQKKFRMVNKALGFQKRLPWGANSQLSLQTSTKSK